MTDSPTGNEVETEEDEDRRRRLIVFWWIVPAVLLLLVILVLLFSSSDDGDDETIETTATTATTTTTAATTIAPTTTSTATSATAESTTTTTVQPTIDGVWTMNIDVTVATGACRGEDDEEVVPDIVSVRQVDNTFTIVGLGFPHDEQVWQGQIDGNVVTFGGERIEDEGKTNATFTLVVDFETSTMTGREDWDWEGPGGTCPESESSVTAVRVGD